MQPYEIRQLSDGSIDYNNYCARPIRLLTPAMGLFARQAASPRTLLVLAAAVAFATIASPLVG